MKQFSIYLLMVLLLIGCSADNVDETDSSRQAEVATRGVDVMPFDLDKTMHVFDPLPDGGLQTVYAKDDQDREQIELIQTHLQEESIRFQNGDFSDPAQIHGEMMPGLAILQEQADELTIIYTPLDDGAQILYTATDDVMITAIHDWFSAQVSDHGEHADHHN